MTRSTFLFVAVTAIGGRASAESITIVAEGVAQAAILVAPEADVAAGRLARLLKDETGAQVTIAAKASQSDLKSARIILCTIASRDEFRPLLSDRAMAVGLKPEGFLVQVDSARGGQIVVMGADPAGLRFGVGELWNYHIRLDGKTATITDSLWLEDAPAFSKRILWNWNFMTNWEEDLARVHGTAQVDPGGKLQPYLEQPDGYEKQFGRVIDYAADHKLNGLIIYGFLNDAHGGVASAQRLSRHAKVNGVRILPGIGTVIYGGFYHGPNDPKNPYSLTTWLNNHPEVRRMVGKDGKTIDSAPCPSAPELREFLVNGAKWFFTTFDDIGGVNVEHGDFFECQCERCKAERAKPENDSNFLWDMMHTHVPLIEAGLRIRPDLWFTYSPYWGYNREMMANPPKFLSQYPEEAIVQWTYSGMVGDPIEKSWPSSLKPPRGAKHSIGLLHQGSYWSGPRQWWGSPGQTYALIADLIRITCARAGDDASEGLEIVGQIGSASPQNELNYLALESFTWNPKLSMKDWMEHRLAPIYGGPDLAGRFYELAGDETKEAGPVEAAAKEARGVADRLKDPRQVRRWLNLSRELARRHALIKAGKTQPFGPGRLEGVEDLQIAF